ELVDALDPNEVPTCGPGMGTRSPTNKELYCDGFLEVPTECGPCANGGNCGRPGCGPMGAHGHVGGCQCEQCLQGHAMPMEMGHPHEAHPHGEYMMEESYGEPQLAPPGADSGPVHGELRMPTLPS